MFHIWRIPAGNRKLLKIVEEIDGADAAFDTRQAAEAKSVGIPGGQSVGMLWPGSVRDMPGNGMPPNRRKPAL